MKTKPILKDYLNVQQYLEDLYKYRKLHENDFSYETWSEELGINNRSYLRLIVTGRRSLSAPLARQLMERLNFQGSDREYFEALVLYSRARGKEQRNIYGRRLAQLMRGDVKLEPLNNAEKFLIKPLWPRLHTFLSFKDTPRNVAEIAYLMRTSESEVTEGLEVLSKLGLIALTAEGFWQVVHESFKVRDDLGSLDLLRYHSDSLREAIEAKHMNFNQRRYKSLLMALSESEFQEFLDAFQAFVNESLTRHCHDRLENRQLFQVNFNLHSVSEALK